MTKEYAAWRAMKARCTCPTHYEFENYGGRGITVCREWADAFEAFYAHIGPAPTPAHSLDRIDNERGYEPGNVRWALRKVQRRNTRANVYVAASGLVMCAADWGNRLGTAPAYIGRAVRVQKVAAAFARYGLTVEWAGRIHEAPTHIADSIRRGEMNYEAQSDYLGARGGLGRHPDGTGG